jgi:hypothetical protein
MGGDGGEWVGGTRRWRSDLSDEARADAALPPLNPLEQAVRGREMHAASRLPESIGLGVAGQDAHQEKPQRAQGEDTVPENTRKPQGDGSAAAWTVIAIAAEQAMAARGVSLRSLLGVAYNGAMEIERSNLSAVGTGLMLAGKAKPLQSLFGIKVAGKGHGTSSRGERFPLTLWISGRMAR